MKDAPDANDIVYDTYFFDIGDALRSLFGGFGDGDSGQSLLVTLQNFWDFFSILAILVSIVLFAGYIYAKIRVDQLIAFQNEQIHSEEMAWAHTYGNATKENTRWSDIVSHVSGDNPSEWRVANIEADVLLDEVLHETGYVGVSIADRLKSAAHSPFRTIEDAWEAHKVRNQIAHAGTDFVLTKKIAEETITRYERVFREFGVI